MFREMDDGNKNMNLVGDDVRRLEEAKTNIEQLNIEHRTSKSRRLNVRCSVFNVHGVSLRRLLQFMC